MDESPLSPGGGGFELHAIGRLHSLDKSRFRSEGFAESFFIFGLKMRSLFEKFIDVDNSLYLISINKVSRV